MRFVAFKASGSRQVGMKSDRYSRVLSADVLEGLPGAGRKGKLTILLEKARFPDTVSP